MATALYPPFEARRFLSEWQPRVSLELLEMAHVVELMNVIETDANWRSSFMVIPAPDAVSAYVAAALQDVAKGFTRAFVIRDTPVNNLEDVSKKRKIVGCTRFFQLNQQHRRVQIGGTWLASYARRTGLNRAVKWLLLREAFEVMDLQRVEFTVHPDNAVSQTSLLCLGARFEGMLRQYLTMQGQQCDAAMYSIIASDWPSVKSRLLCRESTE